MKMDNILKKESELLDKRADFFTRLFGLRFSLPITRLFLDLEISENTATFLMLILGFFGSALLAFDHLSMIFGFFLLIFSYVMDYVDGQMARARGKSSVYGAMLDRMIHLFVENISIIFLGYGMFKYYHDGIILIFMLVLLMWNRCQKFFSKAYALIYLDEFLLYPKSESRIIRKNYERSVKKYLFCRKEKIYEKQGKLKKFFSELRLSSYTFTFFIIMMFFVSIFDYILIFWNIELHLKFFVLALFSIYYMMQIIDFVCSYVFSDKVYHQIRELKKNLKR